MTKNEYIYNAKILNVVDGDTVDVELDLGFYVFAKERMRLNGLDTPEMNSMEPSVRKLAKDAKEFVATFTGHLVTIKSYKQDKYGRFLADIYLVGDVESINAKLLANGMAKPYSGGARV